MITSIELGDFLSHSETKLDFENGVTVFVGHNGAGKSSIIDALTFALFGQHTRKSGVGGLDHVRVARRSAGLQHVPHPAAMRPAETVAERHEGVT